ncbi:hypothetical protein Tco_0849047 [Tanacetum coccineum]
MSVCISIGDDNILPHTDYALWEVIVNGDAPAITSARAGTEGPIPLKTAEQKLARKNELKSKSTLLLAILDEYEGMDVSNLGLVSEKNSLATNWNFMLGYLSGRCKSEVARNTFHVSNLKKCHADKPLAVPLDGIHFDNKHHFVQEPVEIMDCEVKRLKRSRIPIIKVRWNSKRGPEFT